MAHLNSYHFFIVGTDAPPFVVNVSSRLMFSGDEVWSRGWRLNPLLQQLCASSPHALISNCVRANSAGGK
jgi:hypothetical protein